MVIASTAALQSLCGVLQRSDIFSFDTETTGLRPYHGDRVVGVSFCTRSESSFYIPLRHREGNIDCGAAYAMRLIRNVFLRNTGTSTAVGWNSKFDCHALGIPVSKYKRPILDAMLATHLVNENLFSYGLKEVAQKAFGETAVQEAKALRSKKTTMAELLPEEVAPYAEQDARLTLRLFNSAMTALQAEGRLDVLFYEVCQYARIIEQVERHGLLINRRACAAATAEARDLLVELLATLRAEAGDDNFNPGSPQQVGRWLGIQTTSREALEKLNDPRAKMLLAYRGHAKAISCFYDAFLEGADKNGRVHASFKLHGTVSGRLSCTNPNLQQLPRTGSSFHKARDFVVSGAGRVLIAADLSQAELRMLAHYSEDPLLLLAYKKNYDIHQIVADKVGISRQEAKTLNFSMVYGAGISATASLLGRTESEAYDILHEHNRMMPRVKAFSQECQRLASQRGYMELWTGRRRRFPMIYGKRDTHTALNNLIQGGVAEIVRIAMMRLSKTLPEGSEMVCQVHDEILFETRKGRVEETCSAAKHAMETWTFKVPILVELKTGRSLGAMHPM